MYGSRFDKKHPRFTVIHNINAKTVVDGSKVTLKSWIAGREQNSPGFGKIDINSLRIFQTPSKLVEVVGIIQDEEPGIRSLFHKCPSPLEEDVLTQEGCGIASPRIKLRVYHREVLRKVRE